MIYWDDISLDRIQEESSFWPGFVMDTALIIPFQELDQGRVCLLLMAFSTINCYIPLGCLAGMNVAALFCHGSGLS